MILPDRKGKYIFAFISRGDLAATALGYSTFVWYVTRLYSSTHNNENECEDGDRTNYQCKYATIVATNTK